MSLTPKFDIVELEASQSQPEVVVNEAIRILEAMSQLLVIDKDLSVPPATPDDGDTYLVPSGASGVWSTRPFNIAIAVGGSWVYVTPKVGYLAYVEDEDLFYTYTSGSPSGWAVASLGGGGGGGGEGISGITVIGVGSPGSSLPDINTLRFTGSCEVTLDAAGVALVDVFTGAGGGSGGSSDSSVDSIGKIAEAAYSASISDPTSMTFITLRKYRPIEPMAPRLQLLQEDFIQDTGIYTQAGNTATPSFADSRIVWASTAATFGNEMRLEFKQVFEQPGICVIIEDIVQSTDASQNVLGIGIRKNSNNFITAYMETGAGTNNRFNLAKAVGGSFSVVGNTTNSTLPANVTGMALTILAGGDTTLWQNIDNQGWVPILNASITNFDWNSPSELAQWIPYVAVTGGLSSKWKVGSFKTGYAGQTALRDFKVVTLLDGTPYVSDGFLYYTATASGNHCAVYRMNPKTGVHEKTGILYFNRGGTHYTDLSVHVVYDTANRQWRVFFATWGSGSFTNVRMWHAVFKGDLLNGVHLVTGLAQISLSQTSGNNATYDPTVIYDSVNSRWLMCYTLSPSGTFAGNYYTVVDESTDLTTWNNVFAKSATTGYEGSWLTKIGGNFYAFSGNGSNYRCWDIAGNDKGTITVDAYPSSGDPPPHFVVFPWFDNGLTEYYALSWQNTQFSIGGSNLGVFSTGTSVLYKATDTETGYEFDAIGIR